MKSEDYVPPADNAELYRDWAPDVLRVVRKQLGPGHRPQDAEDVAADIMEKLVKRDVISMYRADYISEHTGRPVKFRAFLSSMVALYARGKREEVGRRVAREVLLCDAPAGEGAGRWVDQFGGSTWDDYPSLSDAEVFGRFRDYLVLHPGEPGPCSLLSLFDELASRLKNGESLPRSAVQARFGLSATEATGRMGQLRQVLREAPAAEPLRFAVLGRQLTPSEVLAAVTALRGSRGNRVDPALAAISHPLAGTPTKDYIAFGREEIKAYPGIRVPKGSHGDGHSSQTKDAIIHRLERLLAEAGTPVPEPEQEPEDAAAVFESEVWHRTRDSRLVDRLLELARKAYG